MIRNIFYLLFRYLSLPVLLICCLNYLWSYFYYSQFKINIMHYAGTDELILTQGGISYAIQALLLIYLCTVGFWSYDAILKYMECAKFKGRDLLLFAALSLPLLIGLYLMPGSADVRMLLTLYIASGFLLFLLWISTMHYGRAGIGYIVFYLVACVFIPGIYYVEVTANAKAGTVLNQFSNTENIDEPYLKDKEQTIFIGHTRNFNFYYSIINNEGLALPRKTYEGISALNN